MKLLASPARSYPRTPIKLAIVTGLSDPKDCRLSKHQYQLLEAIAINLQTAHVAVDQISILTANFPYVAGELRSVHEIANRECEPNFQSTQPNIFRASISNARQFLRFRTEGFRRAAMAHWEALFNSSERVCLVCGSCGMAMLTDFLAQYSSRCKVDILALGPVDFPHAVRHAASIPQVTIETLQGSRDLISQACYRLPCITIRGLGHMGYWSHPEVREFVCRWSFHKTSES